MIQKMKERFKCQKGFSILELIIVMAVIGILVALIFPRIGALTASARTNTDEGNGRIIAGAVAEAIGDGTIVFNNAAINIDLGDDTDANYGAVVAKINGGIPPEPEQFNTGDERFFVAISATGDISVVASSNTIQGDPDDVSVFPAP